MGWGDGEGAVLVHQDHGPIKTFVNHREIVFDPPHPLSLALIVFSSEVWTLTNNMKLSER